MSAPLFVTRDYRARHHRSRCAAPSCECCWIRWLPLKPRLSLVLVHKGTFWGWGRGNGTRDVSRCGVGGRRADAAADRLAAAEVSRDFRFFAATGPVSMGRGPGGRSGRGVAVFVWTNIRGHAPTCVKIRGVVSNQLLTADLRQDYFVFLTKRPC
jgi:hypothetical protein